MIRNISSRSTHRDNFFNIFIFIFINIFTFLIFPLFREAIFKILYFRSNDKSAYLAKSNNYLCANADVYNFKNKTHSRDVILLYADSFTPGLELALKSLKATGCKARIVILTSKRSFSTESKEYLLETMNITILKGCKENKEILDYPNRSHVNVPHMLRYKCEYDWLQRNIHDVDRILHTDAYDIFFQKDPFSYTESGRSMIEYDKLTFVIEPHYIRGCGWNLAWFTKCYGKQTTKEYQNNFIACSGTIAGNSTMYLQLAELMLNQKEWKTCYQSSHDQPILNYLLWSGKIDQSGIKYKFTGCDGGFATLQWCIVNGKIVYNEYGQVVLPSNIVPSYLHQYPRYQELSNHLYQACKVKH